MDQKSKDQKHQPVLLGEVLNVLSPQKGESYLDLTAGYGGHASSVLKLTGALKKSVLVDRDQEAIEHLSGLFGKDGVQILHSDFYSASEQLIKQGRQFDLILADLGLSSPHLEKASRGFSFMRNGPLDMRMDSRQQLTAHEIVNEWHQSELTQMLRELGEEPRADKIAQAIVRNRPITSTEQLSKVITGAIRGRGKVHPATKAFQAIRIAVNDELDQLTQALPLWIDLLAPGGRLAVISFHSLEDRIVKRVLKEKSEGRYTAELSLTRPGLITASANEIVLNPRARSAKLRAAVKIKIKEGAASAYSGKKQLPVI